MALRFYGISVPLSTILATVYFWYQTQYRPAQKKKAAFQEIDMKVMKRASECAISAGIGDLLHVHYSSYLKSNGKQFETSRNSAEPYVFKLGTCNQAGKPECLKGFQNAVMGMCAGEKRKATIPPKLGYKGKGRPAGISKDEKVVFNIELVDIDKD
mmetsp:Transcript_20475/g.36775  ORF Transcript_20475/g.36775 Transcript_20475/m.36775 type:complete len:156 (-) Transcript_20475:9-476(-)